MKILLEKEKMNSNIYINENDDVTQRYETPQPCVYEEEKITTTINREEYRNMNDITQKTIWDRTPIRRTNLISGPQSAFARLFPDKYRQQEEEEEYVNKQRSKSNDHRYLNINHVEIQHSTSDDDDDDHDHDHENKNHCLRKSRRVRFYMNDEDNNLKTRTKSEPQLNYDPDPEVIYHNNPDKITYTQKVGVRYLKPPTPPPPGPILIREIQSSPPAAPPPLVVSTTP